MRTPEVIAVDRLFVACELLDCALRLYYEGQYHYATLHLAGAAEEILGVYVEQCGAPSSFTSSKSAAAKIAVILGGGSEGASRKAIGDLMNYAKNRTKHGHGPVDFDARQEAKEILDRAVTNYYALMNVYPELPESPLISRFNSDLITPA
jgi:hypothetical protein